MPDDWSTKFGSVALGAVVVIPSVVRIERTVNGVAAVLPVPSALVAESAGSEIVIAPSAVGVTSKV